MPTWNFGDYTQQLADEYFIKNPQNHLWISFGELMRSQAVSEAERLIWAYKGGWTDLPHPSDINDKDRIRYDYAIYEQALYMLQISGAIANGEETTPKWMANNEDSDSESKFEEPSYPVKITPKAKFWLGINIYNPRIGRG